MLYGPIIEFKGHPPALLSVGHDGLFPYECRPLDEIHIVAACWGSGLNEHRVDILLPHSESLAVENVSGCRENVCVHEPGIMWHDRTREIAFQSNWRWLSVYGFTEDDPRKAKPDRTPLLAVLPGSPMEDKVSELMQSDSWRGARDFHARNRQWMEGSEYVLSIREAATRYERDRSLTSKIKRNRGCECQVCGFFFEKNDGEKYCEVHHLELLSDGGLDVASNMLVLCANCHRRFHYGDVKIQNHTESMLEVTVDGVIHNCVVG